VLWEEGLAVCTGSLGRRLLDLTCLVAPVDPVEQPVEYLCRSGLVTFWTDSKCKGACLLEGEGGEGKTAFPNLNRYNPILGLGKPT